MMLYISNPSRQTVVFYYRTKIAPRGTTDNSGPSNVTIYSGEQVAIGQRWSPEETSYVISQIERHGGANAAEAHGRMGSRFTGLLYREVHPVDVEEIITAHESVLAAAEERSVRQTTRGALAFDVAANGASGKRGSHQRIAKVTEVEVKEQLPPHTKATGNEVHFKLSVDPDGSNDARGLVGVG
jgi:hypothetical protein